MHFTKLSIYMIRRLKKEAEAELGAVHCVLWLPRYNFGTLSVV